MGATRQLCTFYVDDLFMGVDVAAVQEVMQTQVITRVPLARPSVAGLINLRGQIITAVDLRICLKRASAPEHAKSLSLIIKTESMPVSFLVDRIGDVLDVEESLFLPTPESVDRSVAALLTGGYRLPEGLLLILDPSKAISHQTSIHAERRN